MATTLHRILFSCALVTSLLHHALSSTSTSSTAAGTSVNASTAGEEIRAATGAGIQGDVTSADVDPNAATDAAPTTTSQTTTITQVTPSQETTTSQTTTSKATTSHTTSQATTTSHTISQATSSSSPQATSPAIDGNDTTIAAATTTPLEDDNTTSTSLPSTTTEYTTTKPCRVPGSVVDLNVTAASYSSLRVTWSPSTDNPACSVFYVVCWTPGERCDNASDTNLTIDSLSACQQYQVSVIDVGEEGGSSPSSIAMQTTLSAVPGIVRDVRVTAPTSSRLDVEWMKLLENPECVQEYIVCWEEHNCITTVAVGLTVANLHACTGYNVSVMAVGSLANSTAASCQGRTLDTVPGNVLNVVLVDGSTSTLQLRWDEPDENEFCVINYTVCWQDMTSKGTQQVCSESAAANYTIPSLQPCSRYNVSIRARGNEGYSSPTHVVLKTQDAVPGNVSNIVLVDGSTSTLQLRWDEPDENEFCVVNYTVCWQDMTSKGTQQVCSESAAANYTIPSLQPCSRYNVSIRARGNEGYSSPTHVVLNTQDAVSGAVTDLVIHPHTTSLGVMWSKPSVNSACATNYRICWVTSEEHYGVKSAGYSCSNITGEQIIISNLLSCTDYYVLVAANGPLQTSANETVHAKTLPLDPSNILGMVEEDHGTTWLQFRWKQPAENPACVLDYMVCWRDAHAGGAEECSSSGLNNYTVRDLLPCSTYDVSIKARGSTGDSSAVQVLSSTRETEPGPVRNVSCLVAGVHNVTLAWEEPSLHVQCVARYSLWWAGPGGKVNTTWTSSTRVTIAGLQPQSMYNVSLAAVTKQNLSSRRVYIVVATDSEPQNSSVVVTATVTCVILICGITGCAIYVYRKGILVWPPWRKYSLRRKSLTHREIAIKDFRSYCDQLLSTPGQIQSEYQLLITLCADFSTTTCSTVGHLPDNKKKNRYVNIIPYDSTRVKLETTNMGVSDYINASYIKGYSGGMEYIAAQGPKEETCEDFWNMVVQQNVQLIIMLTQFEEKDKVKCFRYFPNLRGNVKFGDITIHCITEMMFPIYTQRTFTIYKEGRKKTVLHLHFREWPDFGCPDSTDVMLEFCQVGRQNTESKDMMTVVHCSAGVGRTGTYIAVDILLQHIRENKKVDIFNTVYKLRQQRVSMVQSEAQYVYVYQCIRNALDDPAIMNTEKSSSSHSLEPIYENINLALNSSSYEELAKEPKKVKNHSKNSSHL